MAMVATQERRKRKRISLRWPIHLYRDENAPSIDSTTENLTSNGFYCVSKEPFRVGEQLECTIDIPSGAFGYADAPVRLQCRVKVVRIEDQTDRFGLGCYIEDYELLMSPGNHPPPTSAAD